MTTLPVGAAGELGVERPASARRAKDRLFMSLCLAVTTLASLILVVLVVAILVKGWGKLNWQFLTSYHSRFADQAGIKAALWGSVWVCTACTLVAVPLGVGTAIFLEEYGPKQGLARRLHEFVQLNIANLAGVPSVVYGIIGLTAFARMFGLFGPANISNYDETLRLTLKDGTVLVGTDLGGDDTALTLDVPQTGEVAVETKDIAARSSMLARSHVFTLSDGTVVEGKLASSTPKAIKVFQTGDGITEIERSKIRAHHTRNMPEIGSRESALYAHLPFGGGVLAGALTLALVVLPIVIVATREAFRAVPRSLREGAMALGSTRWQTIWGVVLPAASPGILTGAILAISRAIGEAAPILVVSGVVFIMNTPRNLMSDFSALPLQIYSWASQPQEDFMSVAAAGIVVLLVVLMVFNVAAVLLRQRLQRGTA